MTALRGLLFLFVIGANPAFGQFKLIKDFYYDGGNPTGSSMPIAPFDAWVLHDDQAYFIATDNTLGTCVFKTDGTFDGTAVAVDPAPGAKGPQMKGLSVAGSNLFFLAVDTTVATMPLRLYVGDESIPITPLTNVEVMGPSTEEMISYNDELFFTGNDGQHGFELWKTDGTLEGTVMIKDITAGATGTDAPLLFHAAGNNLYFSVKLGTTLSQLWKTDGSPEGTILIREFESIGINGLPADDQFASTDNTLYFVAATTGSHRDLWKTDGSVDGTTQVFSDSFDIRSIRGWRGKIFFTNDYQSYVSDGTTLNTKKLLNIPGNFAAASEFSNELYFITNNALWKTNGTVAGTKPLFVPSSGFRFIGISSNRNGVLLISVYKFNQTIKLRIEIYDGISSGLTEVHANDDVENINYTYPESAQSIKTFHDDFLLAYAADEKGTEPWITDGTAQSLQLLRDINSWSNLFMSPANLTTIGDKVFFSNDLGRSGIWASDGTRFGTQRITPFRSDFPNLINSSYYNTTGVDGTAVFMETRIVFSDFETTYHFWGSDGTPAGTRIVASYDQDSYIWGTIRGFGPGWNGNYYYFLPNSLMRTDGNSVSLIKSNLDYGFPYIQATGTLKDYFVFLGNSGVLWRSDGTDAGTTPVTPLEISVFDNFRTAGKYCFIIGGNNYQYSLWRTDATEEGTINLQPPGTISNGALDITVQTVLDTVVVFTSKTDQSGRELWRSDGSIAGTFMIKDVATGSADLDFLPVYNDDSLFYFTVNAAGKSTMWKTNGTMDGTIALYDLPEPLKPLKGHLYNNRVFFPATNNAGRTRVWVTDFTSKGTHMLDEFGAASDEINVVEMVATAAMPFILTKDKFTRTKLWTIDPDYIFKKDQSIDFGPIADRKVGDEPFELTAKASSDLPVEFTIADGPGSIDGTILTITGPGIISVNAKQAGNDEFYPAVKFQSFEAIEDIAEITGLEENIDIKLWPNPSTTSIVVSAQAIKTITIKDAMGRDVLSANVTGENTTIDISHLPRGMYLVKLRSDNQSVITRKVILK